MLWGFLSAQAVHFGEKIFEEVHGTGFVGVSESGTGDWLQAPVIEPVPDCGQSAQTVPHGAPSSTLDEGHDDELLFEPELSGREARFVSVFQFLENMSGDQG